MKHLLRILGSSLGSGALLVTQIPLQFLAPQPVRAQAALVCATPGQDGTPGGAISGVINTYFPGTASVGAGATSLPIGVPTGAGTPIQAGDLLLVIQMQGATINSTNTDAYGDGVGGDIPPLAVGGTQPPNGASGFIGATAGIYEYVVATGPAVGGSVPIRSSTGTGLLNSYFNTDATSPQGRQVFQVIRVPQYASATMGNLTASAWNGTTGGILAFDVAGNLNLGGGTANVSGLGFRGGGGRQLQGDTGLPPLLNTDFVLPATRTVNGSKGEGIAGTPRFIFDPTTIGIIDTGVEGYTAGSYGRGAPGTAGGGSTDGNPSNNEENSGGGGGGNGGNGGIGGRSWNSDLPTGGFGAGRFRLAATERLVMGGGGGAGTTNNGTGTPGAGVASSGAPGGGMVFLRTGTVSGTGTILANGSNALDVANDGGGGGGAGGSILATARTSLAGLTLTANGGRGGSPIFDEPHGPGGGGGGGVIVSTPGANAPTPSGGPGGLTGNPATSLNGATAGEGLSIPVPLTNIPGVGAGADCLPQLTVAKATTTPGPLSVPGTATYTITVTNQTGRSPATGVGVSDTALPTGFTLQPGSAVSVTYASGATGPASVVSGGTATAPTFGVAGGNATNSFTIPGGGSVALTFTVNIAATTPSGVYQNPATVAFTDPTSPTPGQIVSPGQPFASGGLTAGGSNYAAASSTAEDVQVAAPTIAPLINKSVRFVQDNDSSNSLTIGDDVEYTIVVRNPSTTNSITDVVVSDIIPSQLRILRSSITVDAGFALATSLPSTDFDATGAQITLTQPGTLPASGQVILRYRARIRPGAAPPIENQALANYTGDGGVPIRSDASDSTNPTGPGSGTNPGIPGPGGNINQVVGGPSDPTTLQFSSEVEPLATKSVRLFSDTDGSGSLTTGDVVEYTVSYRNGPGRPPVPDFQATDQLPAGQLEFVPGSYSFTASGVGTTVTGNPSYNGATDINLTTQGTLGPNGAQLVIRFRATVRAAAGTTVANQAVATFSGGSNLPAGTPLITDALAGTNDIPQTLDDGTNTGNQPSLTGDDDPTLLAIVAPVGNLILEKRITNALRSGVPLGGIPFTGFENTGANAAALQAAGLTPTGVVNITTPTFQAGDEVEYTVYFLSRGGITFGATICDQIPRGTSLVPNTNQILPGSIPNPTALILPVPGGTVFSPLAPLPTGNSCAEQTNSNGSVIYDLGNVSTGNAGFVRFRVRVN